MTYKTILTSLFVGSSLWCMAQQTGEIHYTEIMKPQMEMPEIEGLPEGMEVDMSAFMPDSIVTYMTLSFNEDASLYAESEKEESSTPENATFETMDEDSQVQIKMEIVTDDGGRSTYHSFKDSTTLVQTMFMGQKFLISSEPNADTWKFHSDKINYLGYECSKATTADPEGGELIVWYTTQIPIAIGPAEYSGLPGLILMVSSEDGNYQIKASAVDLKAKPEIKKLKGGKKVTAEEFTKIQEDKMKEMEKMYEGMDGEDGNVIIMRN